MRLFLLTWSLPNDTRLPVDRLSSLKEANVFLGSRMTALVSGGVTENELATLRRLRDDLRESLEGDQTLGADLLKPWLERLPVMAELGSDDAGLTSVRYRYSGKRDALAGAVLARVVEALAEGIWQRLKICPDCQTVFYDRTRPQNRVWCGMAAHGPGGRACGSIAKVRSWRERQKTAEQRGKRLGAIP